jgi:DNA (cytosine-5)-methyltransferase 1
MKAITLFASAGIGEFYLDEIGVEVIASNELIPRRCDLYSKLHPKSEIICGDIRDQKIKDSITKFKADILIASPPCQGISIAGLHRNNLQRLKDERNYLVLHAIEVIKKIKPKYILFENVSAFGSMLLPHNDEFISVLDILILEFGNDYIIESKIVDCADYGIPQYRKRNLIKIYKKGLKWPWPEITKHISVKKAIGHLPSIESGEKSNFFWHFGRKHQERQINWMKNTPTGKSAFENKIHFPSKENGEKVKGYNTTYKRIKWDMPAPTITMRNDAMSSQANVHPGRALNDGSYSDARVLSPLELFILNSLPEDFNPPKNTPEILIRQVMGECIPPLLIKKIFELI